MDVRIPLRLGVGDLYDDFKDHEWFSKNKILALIEKHHHAPFVPDIKRVSVHLKNKFLEKDSVNLVEQDKLTWSRELRTKLDSIAYISPLLVSIIDMNSSKLDIDYIREDNSKTTTASNTLSQT